jgi:hypothetical protein
MSWTLSSPAEASLDEQKNGKRLSCFKESRFHHFPIPRFSCHWQRFRRWPHVIAIDSGT